MKYCCIKCKGIFDEDEVQEKRYYHDEIPGNFYESYEVSPCCSADFDEARECELCGEFYDEEEIVGDEHKICTSCLYDYRRDFEALFEIADDKYRPYEASQVELNAAIGECFTRRQIEFMVRTYIREHGAEFDGINFIDIDPTLIADDLVELTKERKEVE